MPNSSTSRVCLGVLTLTIAAFLIHGYHYGIEDEAIYLPAIKKILDPSLYPRGAEFFMAQARGTVMPWVIAGLTRVTHAPLPWIVIVAQFISIYLFLLGCWMIAGRCFPLARQRWAAASLVTALLTLPVAGTSIYLVDQHLHPRTLASALILMAVALSVDRRLLPSALACLGAVVVHPLMAMYGIAFVIVLWIPFERWTVAFSAIASLPFVARPTPAWRAAVATREYYTLRNWEWYEWLGLVAPMLIVWWFGRVCDRQQLPTAAKLLRRLNVYAAVMCAITVVITIPRSLEFLWPLQPFRYLHTVYVLMVVFAGGLLARNHLRLAVFACVVLACAMGVVQVREFAPGDSPHIEVPGVRNQNAYTQAFLWAKQNTPKDAYFALDPEYMRYSDNYGFRALAERSQMADISKDAGPVTVAPQLAPEWKREVDALKGFEKFGASDFARLRREFGVEWVIVGVHDFAPAGLDCPFVAPSHHSTGAAVCRTPASLPSSSASN